MPTAQAQYLVVTNAALQMALWPKNQAGKLPSGWAVTEFCGQKHECLQWVSRRSTASPGRPPRLAPPAPAVARHGTAVPFARPHAPMRLIVFPHAGSGASAYFFIAHLLQHDPVEVHLVQYPGRETRIKETPVDSVASMVDLLAVELGPLLGTGNFVFMGHSMGALIAFELVQHLRSTHQPLPKHLIISGRQAPQVPDYKFGVDQLSDDDFLNAIGRRYNALPDELVADPEIMKLLLPSLRADFRLVERHSPNSVAPLAIAATVLNGKADPWVSEATARAWQGQFTRPIRCLWFEGGHFFLRDASEQIRTSLISALSC